MDCVNHSGADSKAFCQHCGKALCSECIRTTAAGQILCEPCMVATAGDPGRTAWFGATYNGQPIPGFAVPLNGQPNPSVAAVLGLIPGVGAMYNGQLFKGLIHVVVFAVLVSITDSHGIFGIFVGAWVLYQSFEAFQTAKARRDGLPLPDPFGLNELGSWLNLWSVDSSKAARIRGVPHPGKPAQTPPPTAQGFPSQQATAPPSSEARGPGSAGGAGAWTSTSGFGTAPPYTAPGGWNPVGGSEYEAGYGTGYSPPPYTAPYAGPNPDPYAGSYSAPSGGYTSYSGPNPPGPFVPPIPPMPPGSVGRYGYRGKEPVWAFILIGLGLIFLLNTMGFVGHVFHFAWPLLLIAFGIWMIIRRMGSTRGGSK